MDTWCTLKVSTNKAPPRRPTKLSAVIDVRSCVFTAQQCHVLIFSLVALKLLQTGVESQARLKNANLA